MSASTHPYVSVFSFSFINIFFKDQLMFCVDMEYIFSKPF